MIFDGKEIEERDIEKIKNLAEIGDVEAQLYLAWCYKHGEGVEKNLRTAEYWDEKANDKKSGRVFWASFCAILPVLAITFLFRCCEDNRIMRDANYKVGMMCLEKGGKEYEEKGVAFIRRAAESGNVVAQCQLGICYENGIGVVRNEKEAAELYRIAYRQGCDLALFYLGKCYLRGVGVKQDEAEGMKLINQAASYGVEEAQSFLRQSNKKIN